MFDSVYSDNTQKQKDEPLSIEEFRAKYYHMIELGNKSVKESFAVSQIQRVIEEKDYTEIDMLFQFYTVSKEESLLLKQHGIQPE